MSNPAYRSIGPPFEVSQGTVVREIYPFVLPQQAPAVNPGTRKFNYQIPSPRVGHWYTIEAVVARFYYRADFVPPPPSDPNEPFPGGDWGFNAVAEIQINGGRQRLNIPLSHVSPTDTSQTINSHQLYQADLSGGPINFSWRDVMNFVWQADINWSFTGAPGDAADVDFNSELTLAGHRYRGG